MAETAKSARDVRRLPPEVNRCVRVFGWEAGGGASGWVTLRAPRIHTTRPLLTIPPSSHLLITRPHTHNSILYVRNLPYNITAEEMYSIFGKYGAIRQIRL
jgi:hypothetical protein